MPELDPRIQKYEDIRRRESQGRARFPGGAPGEGVEQLPALAGMGKTLTEIVSLLSVMESEAERRRIQGNLNAVAVRVWELTSRIGFDEFAATWSACRQMIGLQGRLFFEQVFWLMGDPWKSLVTGFGAITPRGSSVLLPTNVPSVEREVVDSVPDVVGKPNYRGRRERRV